MTLNLFPAQSLTFPFFMPSKQTLKVKVNNTIKALIPLCALTMLHPSTAAESGMEGASNQSFEQIVKAVVDGHRNESADLKSLAREKHRDLKAITNVITVKKEQLEELNRQNRQLELDILAMQQALRQKRDQVKANESALEEVMTTFQQQNSSFADNASQFSSWYFVGRDSSLTSLNDTFSLDALDRLWKGLVLQIGQSAQAASTAAEITLADGEIVTENVNYWGTFSHYSSTYGWLRYQPNYGGFTVLAAQPAVSPTADMTWIDPAFGYGFERLAQDNQWWKPYEPMGVVGIIILTVALIGLVIGMVRTVSLFKLEMGMHKQLSQPQHPDQNNMVGRLILAIEHVTCPSKLEDTVDACASRELPSLQRGIGTLAVLAAIAPLLGLLGTVGGMIETFSVMQVKGASNSDLLSGGIAEALLTTKMGLITAIPLLLLHCLVKTRAKKIAEIYEHQVAAYVVSYRHQNSQH